MSIIPSTGNVSAGAFAMVCELEPVKSSAKEVCHQVIDGVGDAVQKTVQKSVNLSKKATDMAIDAGALKTVAAKTMAKGGEKLGGIGLLTRLV